MSNAPTPEPQKVSEMLECVHGKYLSCEYCATPEPQPLSDTDQRLREIQERVEKATPGPWMLDGTDNDGMRYVEDKEHAIGQFWQEEDAALIANAPADLAWLLEQLAALRLVEARAMREEQK